MWARLIVVLFACCCVSSLGAQESEDSKQSRVYSAPIEEIVVVGDLGSLPHETVDSVFGFGRSLLYTPRSASTVSEEMIARFDMRDVDELIVLAPGSFTQSFFGIAGSLEVRGTPGETYFRGMRRLDNPGNYPTPIGASDRIDIVRGPASPIFGPAKIGGYLNFIPKSARAEETRQLIDERTGAVSFAGGSWDKRVLTAEIGGPLQIGNQGLGYYFYSEVEDSGSYYRNSGTEQFLLQSSLDMNVSDRVHLEFGGMYQQYKGNQIAGWNRLTQALIDDGIYITGQPLPLDTDGDGLISHQEFDVDGDGFSDLSPFAAGIVPGTPDALSRGTRDSGVCSISSTLIFGCNPDLLGLVNVGEAVLDGSDSLNSPDDRLDSDVITLYFDAILRSQAEGWEWKNQLFYEAYENLNESTFGFAQIHDTWVIEDKIVGSNSWRTSGATLSMQMSPSLRFTKFKHADDYTNEHFDRRDITRPASPLDSRLLATQIDSDYTEYYIGEYLNLGIAALSDITWDNGFNVLLGVRYDIIDMKSRQPVDKLLLASSYNFCVRPDDTCVRPSAADRADGFSWTFSVSYASEIGLVPYATFSEQSTVIAGQAAQITTDNIASGSAFDVSSLEEVGLKGSFLNNSLYFAISLYEQQRTDHTSQAIVTNQASESKGWEVELRWVPTEKLLLTLGHANLEVTNLNTLETGARFSFLGADDVPGVQPGAFYAGSLAGLVIRPGRSGARRAGVPENISSLTATYDFGNGVAVSASVVDVDAVYSGFSNSVRLPAYTLINAGIAVDIRGWSFNLTAKNLTDERYFRANFPNLFGGVIVLPELPRNYQARIEYRW